MSWYLKRCLQLPLPCLSVCLPQEGLFPNHCSNYFDQAAKCQSGLPLVGDHMGWAWANYFIFNKFQGLEASYHHNSNTTLPLTATLSGCAAARRQKQPGCPSPEAQWKYSTHTHNGLYLVIRRNEMHRKTGRFGISTFTLIKTATTRSLLRRN